MHQVSCAALFAVELSPGLVHVGTLPTASEGGKAIAALLHVSRACACPSYLRRRLARDGL